MDVTKVDFQKIADKYGMTKGDIKNIYYDTFEFIYKTISSLEYTKMSDEELNAIKTSFNLPGLGKLYLDKHLVKKFAKVWKRQ